MQHSLEAYGEETAAKVLDKAQEWIARFTVVIATAGSANSAQRAQDIQPGSGVVVKLNSSGYGVLTAAHVLKRGGANTKNSVAVALLAPPPDRAKQKEVMAIGASTEAMHS